MGWFDEQIKERRQYDDDAFSEAFANMASAVMGKRFEAAFTSDRAVTKDAIDEILKYYHVKSREVPDSIKDVNEQLEFLMRPYGIMRRTVKLEDGIIRDVRIEGGCNGNLQGISRLVIGMKAEDAIERMKPERRGASHAKISTCLTMRRSRFISHFRSRSSASLRSRPTSRRPFPSPTSF